MKTFLAVLLFCVAIDFGYATSPNGCRFICDSCTADGLSVGECGQRLVDGDNCRCQNNCINREYTEWKNFRCNSDEDCPEGLSCNKSNRCRPTGCVIGSECKNVCKNKSLEKCSQFFERKQDKCLRCADDVFSRLYPDEIGKHCDSNADCTFPMECVDNECKADDCDPTVTDPGCPHVDCGECGSYVRCYDGECCPECYREKYEECCTDCDYRCCPGNTCTSIDTDACGAINICIPDTYTGNEHFCEDCAAASCIALDPESCQFGYGFDYCGCCPECLRGPGEFCGGPHNYYGTCGEGFFCQKFSNNWCSPGVCAC